MDNDSAPSLMDKVILNSTLLKKPKDLPFEQIVDHVARFMKSSHESTWIQAYGNEGDLTSEWNPQQRFNPQEVLAENPDRIELITAFVDQDMQIRLEQLLENAQEDEISYKIILFGIGLMLAREEPVTKDLRSVLVDHLLAPRDFPKIKDQGRPRKDMQSIELTVLAIKYAMSFGLTRTRGNESLPLSACDAVEAAARQIYSKEKITYFGQGFGFENLKKVKL